MKAQLLKLAKVTLALGILCGLGAGCAWSIGGKHGPAPGAAVQPTRGQQLIDLKKALDQKAITEQEYEEQKAKIIAQ